MKKTKTTILFFWLLTLLMSLSYLLQEHFGADKLTETYLFNYLFTLGAFWVLMRQQKRREEILGFVFMGLSGVKFLLFFLVYKPFRLAPPEKEELFLAFFIPYAVCAIVEVYFLVKLLNAKSIEK